MYAYRLQHATTTRACNVLREQVKEKGGQEEEEERKEEKAGRGFTRPSHFHAALILFLSSCALKRLAGASSGSREAGPRRLPWPPVPPGCV